MVSKEEWLDWMASDVTKEILQNITEVVEGVAADLINRRKSDPMDDMYLRGFVRGVQSLLEWRPEENETSNQRT